MCGPKWDKEDGGFSFAISDNMAMSSNGNLLVRISDNTAMDMESGDIHVVSPWPDSMDMDSRDRPFASSPYACDDE